VNRFLLERLVKRKKSPRQFTGDRVVRLKVFRQPGKNAIDRSAFDRRSRRASSTAERFLRQFKSIYTPVFADVLVWVILFPPLAVLAQPLGNMDLSRFDFVIDRLPCALVISRRRDYIWFGAATRQGAFD